MPLIPALKAEASRSLEFKASLVYKASSRRVRAVTLRNLLLKTKKETNKHQNPNQTKKQTNKNPEH